MSAVPWIIVSIATLILVLLAVAVIIRKGKKGKHETDYRTFFYMGLIWVIIYLVYMLFRGFEFNGFFAMGVIFFILGLANRDKWKKTEHILQLDRRRNSFFLDDDRNQY